MTQPLRSDLVLVGSGAAAGALVRWAVVPIEQHAALGATLAVNVVGSFLLGLLPGVPAVRRSRRAALALGTGLLGGFTTVSAWSGQVSGLVDEGRASLAGLLLAGTVAGALVAAHLGRRCAAALSPEPVP